MARQFRRYDITTLDTLRMEAVTSTLDAPTIKQSALSLPGLLTEYDLHIIRDFAREDGVTPRTFLKRLLSYEYHRRMIGREVEAMEVRG